MIMFYSELRAGFFFLYQRRNEVFRENIALSIGGVISSGRQKRWPAAVNTPGLRLFDGGGHCL